MPDTMRPTPSTFAPPRTGALVAAVVALLLPGCGSDPGGTALPNLRPEVRLTAAPRPLSETNYQVALSWSGYDPDGRIERFEYALDPAPDADTAWIATTAFTLDLALPSTSPSSPVPPAGTVAYSRDAHTFVLRAIDGIGDASPRVSRSFTSRTVSPEAFITAPIPNRQQPTSTRTSVTVRWRGIDSDAIDGAGPVGYRIRLVLATAVRPVQPELVTAAQIQEYFAREALAGFVGWETWDAATVARAYEGLSVDALHLFAVVAVDGAGATTQRFLRDANVLLFRPQLRNLGPRITLANEFFSRTQTTGGISLDPSRIPTIEVPEGVRVGFRWSALANTGSTITGYRWALDLAGGDITDETPRADDFDINRWSTWSISETSAGVGPFAGSADTTRTHFMYVEARDDLGFVSLFTLRMNVIRPTFENPLLVIDDMDGTLSYSPANPYPTEAEQDTFHFAVGGVPDRLLGGTTVPGAFAGLPYDTLDWRSARLTDITLERLGRYRVVAWYADNRASGQNNALVQINTSGRLNTLAAYLRQGGKLFLFGEGAPACIGNGFLPPAPFIPYSSSPANARQYVLRQGNFLHDYLHLRSEMNTAGTASISFTRLEQLRGAIPYLPPFRGPASDTDRAHDPRIGPGAERTALRWSALPHLTLDTFRGANPDVNQRSINQTWYVSKPNVITEGTGAAQRAVLDTLYLLQARDYSGAGPGALSDGMPNAIHYYGSEHGEVVWFGFPLHSFHRDEARAAVHAVMRVLGVDPLPASERRGPGASR